MSIEEYKQAFLKLFKEMQDEFKSGVKCVDIWHNKSWIDSDPEVYNVNITFGDN